MAILVVLPHCRLQHRIRYFDVLSRTSICLGSGWKLSFSLAHSLALVGSALIFGHGSALRVSVWRRFLSISGCLPWRRWQIVVDVDAFGDVVGREENDFVVGELAVVGGDDLRIAFGDVDGGFAFWCFRLLFFGNGFVFNGFGDVGKIGVDFLYAFAEAGDADFEAVDLPAHLFDGAAG